MTLSIGTLTERDGAFMSTFRRPEEAMQRA